MRLAGLVLLSTAVVSAQPAAEFEVATVKPAVTREINGFYTYPGGRIVAHGCTLHYLMEVAFGVQAFQVTGGPGWIEDDRFDVEAKPPASSRSAKSMPPYPKVPPNEEQRQMLEWLLVQRFGLKFHREDREGQAYFLIKGKNALKLTDSKDKNAYPWAGGLQGGGITGDGLAGTNESMADLAKRLRPYMGRPVLDRTGIEGAYDFRYEYRGGDEQPDAITVILASLQGIGLKLEPGKGPVETIVIDRASKPSAN
ncbi:MAG TPA: TIGR03435 family protein [Bryobacteraceae bacterium]|nr:TIGR03435 family protein [Bryobacteraceae bacterium]